MAHSLGARQQELEAHQSISTICKVKIDEGIIFSSMRLHSLLLILLSTGNLPYHDDEWGGGMAPRILNSELNG
jgi:hypothetical protein